MPKTPPFQPGITPIPTCFALLKNVEVDEPNFFIDSEKSDILKEEK
jgi:hypothetical protein